jgi:nicotinate-nucleotide adenylyltransferase
VSRRQCEEIGTGSKIKRMKVALFGGSFDPPHQGHVALARLAVDRLHLDRVLMAPVGSQPLKQASQPPASFEDRVEMVRLAIADEPGLEASLIDAPRSDGRPNFTIHTIKRLKSEIHPSDQLFCLMGADSFLTIGRWYRASELLMSCDFIVASRPGFDLSRIAAALPENISLASEENPDSETDHLVIGLRSTTGEKSRLYLLPDLAEEVSATEIRSELAEGQSKGLAPSVAAYITRHRLYRNELKQR